MSSENVPSRETVLALYGAAMLAAQRFEESMMGLAGTCRELSVLTSPTWSMEQMDEFDREWGQLFMLTAGRLEKELSLPGPIGAEITAAVRARNLLAHHYLRDHMLALNDDAGRVAMADRLTRAADRFETVTSLIDQQRDAVMRQTIFTEDHVGTAVEARWMQNYDPDVDDAVPPEPFEE